MIALKGWLPPCQGSGNSSTCCTSWSKLQTTGLQLGAPAQQKRAVYRAGPHAHKHWQQTKGTLHRWHISPLAWNARHRTKAGQTSVWALAQCLVQLRHEILKTSGRATHTSIPADISLVNSRGPLHCPLWSTPSKQQVSKSPSPLDKSTEPPH